MTTGILRTENNGDSLTFRGYTGSYIEITDSTDSLKLYPKGITFNGQPFEPGGGGGLGTIEVFPRVTGSSTRALGGGTNVWGFYSTAFCPATDITVASIKIFVTAEIDLGSARLGIYQQGDPDTLLGETAYYPSEIWEVGFKQFSLLTPVSLQAGTWYSAAIVGAAAGGGSLLATSTGTGPAVPNHIGRDTIYVDDPVSALPATFSGSVASGLVVWFSVHS